MQKVPLCKGLVGIEAVVEARASRIAGSGNGEGFQTGLVTVTASLPDSLPVFWISAARDDLWRSPSRHVAGASRAKPLRRRLASSLLTPGETPNTVSLRIFNRR